MNQAILRVAEWHRLQDFLVAVGGGRADEAIAVIRCSMALRRVMSDSLNLSNGFAPLLQKSALMTNTRKRASRERAVRAGTFLIQETTRSFERVWGVVRRHHLCFAGAGADTLPRCGFGQLAG